MNIRVLRSCAWLGMAALASSVASADPAGPFYRSASRSAGQTAWQAPVRPVALGARQAPAVSDLPVAPEGPATPGAPVTADVIQPPPIGPIEPQNAGAPWRNTAPWGLILPPGRVIPPGYYVPCGPCVPNGPIMVRGPMAVCRPMDSPPVYPGGPLPQGQLFIPRPLLAPGGPLVPVVPSVPLTPRGQVVDPGEVGAPTHVPGPGQVPRIIIPNIQMLSRTDAVRVALRNCAVVRTLVGDQGTTPAGTIFDRGVSNAQITAAWSAFDTSVGMNMFWSKRDEPSPLSLDGAFRVRNQLDLANGNVFVNQPLKTGGQVGVSYGSNYSFFPPNQVFFPPGAAQNLLNPQYFNTLTYSYTQPLLQGAGLPVNMAPIVIAKTAAAQSVWDFKQAMLALIRSVETTYWDLSATAAQLDVIDMILPRYEEVVRVARSKGQLDAATASEVAQAQTRYWEFRRLRLIAQINLANQEALLRNVLGLPPGTGNPLRTASRPTRARVVFNWDRTMDTAYRERPDISRQRLTVYIRRQELLVAENSFLPTLNGVALYQPNGLGTSLSSAAALLGDNRFADWTLGFNFSVPLQRRLARGNIRATQLSLARDRSLLNQTTHSATHNIARLIRELYIIHDQAQVAEEARDAAKIWADGARASFLDPRGEITEPLAVNLYLQALRAWNEAAQQAIASRALYNTQLALIGEAVGSLLEDYNIALYGDPSRQLEETIGPFGQADSAEPVMIPMEPRQPTGRNAEPLPDPPLPRVYPPRAS